MSQDQAPKSPDRITVPDADLIPIRREEIAGMSPLPTDFFVRLSQNNFILVGRRGAQKMQELHAIQDAKVADLYVRREEYKNCVGANLQIAEMAVTRAELSDLKKIDFLYRATDGVFREIEALGFNRESLEHAKSVANSVIALVAAKNDLNQVMQMMNSVSGELMRHSMAVSSVSVMIAAEMNWTLKATLQKLALAGLMHDIGLKELSTELLEKPRHLMNATEVREYETHVTRGVEILRSMPSVQEEIVSVAMEHHENAIGQGYPRHLRDVKMNPMSRIVALADCFCDLTLKSANNPHERTAEDAVKYIELTLGQPYSKPAFQALRQTLSLDVRRKKPIRIA